ncbi:hypothetical protein ACIQNU_40515 [Streptomyces sp. NPDC091292]|uniref:hypothetical protein n=1 Tax=Streptomyces sp. NPDC091292 TaxID=3365991 RepID=UPI00382C628A
MSAADAADDDLADLQFFEIPHMRRLTAEQNAGAACVWCAAALAPGAGVDLGEGMGWRPHSCGRCYPLRVAVVRTFRNLHAHWTSCTPCEGAARVGDRLCAEATTRQAAHLRARKAADKETPTCFSCRNPITERESQAGTFAPHVWTAPNSSTPYRTFVHTGVCLWNETVL